MLENEEMPKDSVFVMIGTVRGPDDQKIVNKLKEIAIKNGLINSIRFEIN